MLNTVGVSEKKNCVTLKIAKNIYQNITHRLYSPENAFSVPLSTATLYCSSLSLDFNCSAFSASIQVRVFEPVELNKSLKYSTKHRWKTTRVVQEKCRHVSHCCTTFNIVQIWQVDKRKASRKIIRKVIKKYRI